MTILRLRSRFLLAAFLLLSAGLSDLCILRAQSARAATRPTGSTGEASAARAFEQARAAGPQALYAFLYNMPKGGDLHNHLSGAVYAESWIAAAAADRLCVDVNTHAFVVEDHKPAHCDPLLNPGTPKKTPATGTYPAASLGDDQPLYDALVDAFSMRGFVPRTGESGHDHFFDTFDKFAGTSHAHIPQWLDEVAARAAGQNEQYLELMHTPDFTQAAKLADSIGFHDDYVADRQKMLAAGLKSQVAPIVKEMDAYLAEQRSLENCDTPSPAPACGVTIRFIYQVLRNRPPATVFAQILLGFEVAAADPAHFVAINLVEPEDDYYAMRDYHMHMQMIAALRRFYPAVHVSLHAGELAPGLVPPGGLLFHIRDAVQTAGAERIGHGVDVMGETDPNALLDEMAAKHVMVEINLTSNEGILDVAGATSPLPFYLKADVPVALSTDDEGVNRGNLTEEYTKAASLYGLTYQELKNLARNSLTYSFLPGESLWPIGFAGSMYHQPVSACRALIAHHNPAKHPAADPACAGFLATSEKATRQWELETRFAEFEAAYAR